jgi:hypothetical protein
MKPSNYLLFAVSYLGLASAASIANPDANLDPIEKRGCFQTGEKYGEQKDEALKAARSACSGPLRGTYNKRETRVKCYNIGNNKHVKLTVGLTGKNAPSSRNIGSDECYRGLEGRIEACPKGDDKEYGNWRYRQVLSYQLRVTHLYFHVTNYCRADPNKGPC